ncbi:hypothetical protein IKH83_00340 [Candidatus Saccharibacteria bacterium]|nr:hypothetical protein [Candidatus Saccharibacteria bacterium]
MKYNKNEKLFDIYVFLTTFSRNLIEVFVGTFLFKLGFSVHEVVLYILLAYIFSTLLAYPCVAFSKKFSNELLAFVSVFAFIGMQFTLNHMGCQLPLLVLVSFLFALYRKTYWIARRYYTLRLVSHQQNVARKYSVISVINQLGVIIAAYAGSVFLEFFTIDIITIISFVLLTISTVTLHFIKVKPEKDTTKIQLFKTLRRIPFSGAVHIICYELVNISKILLPVFIILYVKDTYTAVGIVTLIANVAALIFIYVYGRIINKKRNFLRCSILIYTIMKICQVNSTGILLAIFTFCEGFALKAYEQSFHKEYLIMSRKFDGFNFNLAYEIIMDVGRLAVVAFLFFFIADIKTMLYIVFGLTSVGLLFRFNKH